MNSNNFNLDIFFTNPEKYLKNINEMINVIKFLNSQISLYEKQMAYQQLQK
jgi:hypothetical protein